MLMPIEVHLSPSIISKETGWRLTTSWICVQDRHLILSDLWYAHPTPVSL